ncbi:hypothetical protein ACF1G0_04790 [Streptomyces sp. NPDC013953]|uniref:hypothetical protein n=1 Tax=Streptomyces sp. NPDC013953 TaxID=3364868 RepID=UPI003701498B
MKCPHCATGLKRAERTGRVCAHCERRFALDPREDGKGMHDLRIRRCAERATDAGRLTVTLTQLWYLSRTHDFARPAVARRGVPPGLRWLVALPAAAALVVCAIVVEAVPAYVPLAGAVAALVAAAVMRHRPARAAESGVEPFEETFRRLMTGHWTRAYGSLPEGVVDDRREAPSPGSSPGATTSPGTTSPGAAARVSGPRAVILCTDPAVSVFLEANGIPARLGAVLVDVPGRTGAARYGPLLPTAQVTKEALRGLDRFRAGLPVVVLHDAGVQGALLAPLLRAARPDRDVVDAGLPASAVSRSRGAVRLLMSAPPAGTEELRTVAGLSEADAAWLAEGFWSPLAAVPPPLLESVTVRAVEHALTAPAPVPGTGDARGHGFLTWPADAHAPGTGTSRTEGTSTA